MTTAHEGGRVGLNVIQAHILNLSDVYSKEVRPWVDLIDTLRQQGIQQDLPLPQIAVMGDQSSGKSSVLESISGIPFPRGSGIVTRCATQLIMKKGRRGDKWYGNASVSWGSSRPQPPGAGAIPNPSAVAGVIAQLTEALTDGAPNGISSESIIIEVRAPDLPDLTLIDLPGIVRTSTAGQTSSVIEDVNSLIASYLRQERTIVLAVVPSNQDIATVDILERALQVDPRGERTLGVLTKPDLIGPGNEQEVLSVLNNVRKPLRLGYVMVKNRSQQQINDGSVTGEAREDERRFFSEHDMFRSCDPKLLGVQVLTKRLTSLLVKRIQSTLPAIKYELQSQLAATNKELKPFSVRKLGLASNLDTALERHHMLMRVVSEYCRLLRASARGEYHDDLLMDHAELRLHSETTRVYHQLQQSVADTMPGFNDAGFNDRLKQEMVARRGRELPGFLNSQVFYGFIVENVESWRTPVETCRAEFCDRVLSVSSRLIEHLVPQFPQLCNEVRHVVSSLIEKLGEDCVGEIEQIFLRESDPFTTNDDMFELINRIRFQNFDKVLADVMVASFGPSGNPGSVDKLKGEVKKRLGQWYMTNHGVGTNANVEDMRTILRAYWRVATKRLVDNVCMTLDQQVSGPGNLLQQMETGLFVLARDDRSMQNIFREDMSVQEKKHHLIAKKGRLEFGLAALKKMAPGCIGRQGAVSAAAAAAEEKER